MNDIQHVMLSIACEACGHARIGTIARLPTGKRIIVTACVECDAPSRKESDRA